MCSGTPSCSVTTRCSAGPRRKPAARQRRTEARLAATSPTPRRPRHTARTAGVRRGARAGLDARHPADRLRPVSSGLQEDGPGARQRIARIVLPKRAARWRSPTARSALVVPRRLKVCLAATVDVDRLRRPRARRPDRARQRRAGAVRAKQAEAALRGVTPTRRRSRTPSGHSSTTSNRSTICVLRPGIACTWRRAFSPSAWRPSDQLRVPRA